jgi:hypothetical protein
MRFAGYFVNAALLVAAVFHLLPLAGVLGAERLAALYGVRIADPALLLLMRHRALLFGVLGLLMLCAAFADGMPWTVRTNGPAPSGLHAGHLQLGALVAALVSTGGFVLLAWSVSFDAPLQRVMRIDMVLFVMLACALAARSVTLR